MVGDAGDGVGQPGLRVDAVEPGGFDEAADAGGTVAALPRDANASSDIFGGWTLSQMDLAGGTFAAAHVSSRVVTVRIDAVEFLESVSVGDDVSVFCALEHEGETSIAVRIEVWARVRTGDAPPRSPKACSATSA